MMLILLARAALTSATAADTANTASASCPQPFRTTYSVEWHGMSAGTSTLELTRKNDTEYTFRSSNAARGLFRIALPDTITQISNFSIVNGTVLPASYVGDDGSTDTERDVSLNFNWTDHRVTGTAENKPVDQPIEPGVQDSLSVQVALMCALASGTSPKSFKLIDKDEIKEYQYTREGEASLTTSVGKLHTVIYKSQKAGASRATRFWIAPSLGFLPVRAEQSKRDKREVVLQIRSVDRTPSAAATQATHSGRRRPAS
ncbi:MAG: DUF3108 domain-containing protein [Gammaproteobacteria bacterium]